MREQGEFRALRTFLRQPARRGRPPRKHPRPFLGTKKGRKIHYGRVPVAAQGGEGVPEPPHRRLSGL